MPMSPTLLRAALEALGWSQSPCEALNSGATWAMCRPTHGLPVCICNDRSPQVVTTLWPGPCEGGSVSVRLRAESPAGWVDLAVNSLPLDPINIHLAHGALIRAWVAICQGGPRA